jgi:hypothetical protein
LLRVSRGGVTLDAALDMDREDFDQWFEAAVELEKRIAKASKG